MNGTRRESEPRGAGCIARLQPAGSTCAALVADDFGFPIGFSSHEDLSFPFRTTQELLDTGRVGPAYVDRLASALGDYGQRIQVQQVPAPTPLALIATGALF